EAGLGLHRRREPDVVADLMSQDRLEGVTQVLLPDHRRVHGDLAGAKVDLGDARLRRVLARLAEGQEPRPVGLGQGPAAAQLAPQLVGSHDRGAGHVALPTIQSFCESAALATRYPARTRDQRNGPARKGNDTFSPRMWARPPSQATGTSAG